MSCPSGVLVRLQNFLIGNKEVLQPNELSVKHRYSVWAAGRVMKALCLVEGSLGAAEGNFYLFILVLVLRPLFSSLLLSSNFFLLLIYLCSRPHPCSHPRSDPRPRRCSLSSSLFSSAFSSLFSVHCCSCHHRSHLECN